MEYEIERSRTLALTFLDACFRLDVDAAASMMSEDFSWWVLGDSDGLRVSGQRNRDGAIRMLTSVRRMLPNGMRHDVLGVTAERGRVAVEVTANGLLETGCSYRNSYHFALIVDGKQVVRVREYLDTFAVSRLPGALRRS